MDCTARIPLEPGVVERLERLIASYESGAATLPARLLEEAPLPESRLGVVRLAERIAEEAGRGVYGKVYAIVGEWGMGKSWAGAKVVEALRARGVEARLEHLDNLVDTALQAMEGRADPRLAREAMIESLSKPGLPAVVVVDEVEGILRSIRGQATEPDRAAVQAFLDILKSLFDPRLKYGGLLRGRLTLVLLMTREAFNHLRGLLEEAGVGGRFLRRSDVVFLQPLARYESIRLARYYVEALTGRSPGEVFEDERLLEVFHTVSGGVPGTLLEALIKTLRAHIRACGGGCLCRVTPASLLDTLSQITVTSESGAQYTPLDREEAEALLARLRVSREALLLVASTSTLAPEEAVRAAPALQAGRVGYARVIAYRIGDLADWFEAVREKLCRDGGELCVAELRSSVGSLVHYHPGYGWILTLPRDPGELASWLEYYGWTGGRDPREVYEAIRPGPGMQGWVTLRPEYAGRIYKSRPPTGLEFLPSPKAREHARDLLRAAEESRERMEELVAQGLRVILEYSGLARPGEHPGVYVYRYDWQGYGASTRYEVPVHIIPAGARPVEACRENPKLKASIILVPGGESREESCPGLTGVPLEAGVRRRLALIAAGLEAADKHRVQVDHDLLGDTAIRLARDLGLPEALAGAAERLREAGIIVEPRSEALYLAQSALGVGRDIVKASMLLADAHYYLVVAGSPEGSAGREEAARAAGILAELTPYAKTSHWCGVQIPRLSDVDIGKSRGEVEEAISRAVDYLVHEGLAAHSRGLVASIVRRERIASRIIEAFQGKRATLEQILEAFILPVDEAYRREAEARVKARLEALSHLGYVDIIGRRGELYEVRRERKTIPAPTYGPRAAGSLRRQIEAAATLIARVSPGTMPKHLGTLLVYKQKDAKIITPRLLEEVYDYLQELRRVWNGTPARRQYYDSTIKVYNLYIAQLAEKAVEALTQSIRGLRDQISEARRQAEERLGRLRDLIRGEGPTAELVSRIRGEIEGLLAEALEALARGVATAMELGDGLVEDPARGRLGGEADDMFFRKCEGRNRRPPPHYYSPHLYYWQAIGGKVVATVEEKSRKAVELATLAAMLADRIKGLGMDPDAVSSKILDDAGKMSLARALEYTLSTLESELREVESRAERARRLEARLDSARGRLEEAEEALRAAEATVARLSSHVDVGEAERLLAEARRSLSMAENLVGQAAGYHRSGKCIDSENALKYCLGLLERAVEHASSAQTLAGQAASMVKRVFDERVERARDALERARVQVERLRAEAAGVGGVQEQEVLAAARRAEEILEAADPARDPAGAEEAARRALEIVDEARRRLIPEEARALYDLLVRLREGEVDLETVLEEAGRAAGDILPGLRRLLAMASRHGYRLTVRARERRG